MAADLVQLGSEDIATGVPLAFAVYDGARKLVCDRGQVIENADRVVELIRSGAYRQAENREPHAQEERALPDGANGLGFEDARLHVGDPLQLQSRSGGERYYVKLIGYVPGGSVLVTTPRLDGHVLLMREGQGFIARAFSGKTAFAFNTIVRRVCNTPFPYLHLDFPKVVEGVAVRRDPRLRVRVVASVTAPAGHDESRAAVISDLSVGGARIEAHERLGGKGDSLRVSFRLDFEGDDAHFDITAINRSVREDRRGDEAEAFPFVHGVEFVDMSPNERMLLKTLIYQRLAEGARE